MLMFSFNAVAETINIIVSGKAGGTFHTRSMLMHDTLVDMGYEVNLINAGNLSKAAQLFRTSKDPVIMPWIDSANIKENLQPTKSTFGVLEYTAPVVFCSTKYNLFEAPKIKIGHSASWPIDIFIVHKHKKFIFISCRTKYHRFVIHITISISAINSLIWNYYSICY